MDSLIKIYLRLLQETDGKIFRYHYDQITPKGSTKENFSNALRHARDKKADMALVYIKYNRHTRQTVTEGLKYYEEKNPYRFKQILIVTPYGRIHRHKHN
jgi:hypothetical protein